MVLICQQCGKPFESVRWSRKFCSCACSNANSNARRSKEFDDKPTQTVWSSGGGIQSTAIAVLIWNGTLPKPDFAFMADCGYESQSTYDYAERVLKPKMAEVGVEYNVVKSSDYVDVELINRQGFCTLPAFRLKEDGSVSHLSTHCNGVWKQQVMKKWLREHGVEKAENWIGISTDEARRANRSNADKWLTKRYPLLELGLSRKDCANLIRDNGWELPQRTSCIMCPQRTRFEWLRLMMESPDDFKRAVEIDERMRRIDPTIFLLPDCKPLREILDNE